MCAVHPVVRNIYPLLRSLVAVTLLLILAAFTGEAARAQGPQQVLIVVNRDSALSKTVAEYYARRRSIPEQNVCRIRTTDAEDIERVVYDRDVAKPIAQCLKSKNLVESILYIVTTAGVPLRIAGEGGPGAETSAVDSELTLLYSEIHGHPHQLKGAIPNPFFGKKDATFRHPDFPIYLVTRLAGYDFADIKGLIDRALIAKNRGRFVIDMKEGNDTPGENWLRDAAIKIPDNRLLFEQTNAVVYEQKDVIGYAAWGSNDFYRHKRMLGFQWLPGAIMTEYVSTNARTFTRPPDTWNIGNWKESKTWFANSPQSLTADYIHEGVTGASGHVSEPYLHFCPRPDLLLPAYYSGRNLAESYYLAIPGLSWQNIVVGDPLCSLGKP